jgi:hypothetical protein
VTVDTDITCGCGKSKTIASLKAMFATLLRLILLNMPAAKKYLSFMKNIGHFK